MVDTIDPEITMADVRLALNDLLYSPTHKATRTLDFPLYHLLLVKQRVDDPTHPDTPLGAALALAHVLTETISTQYTHHRTVCGLNAPKLDEPQQACRVHVADDAAQHNIELLAWSWLYYRYVRVDAAIDADWFGAVAGSAERTLRRYANHGLRRLTQLLIKEEQILRRREKQDWLYTRLPIPVARTLFGREPLLARMHALLRRAVPRHLQITGESGVGKSVLAHEFVRGLIDRDEIDQLIWIDGEMSIDGIRSVLNTICKTDLLVYGLRGYMMRHRTAVVIDGIDHLALPDLDALQADLGRATLVLIGQDYLPLNVPTAHILVPELDSEAAAQYVDYLWTLQPHQSNDKLDPMELMQHTSGNPQAIRVMMADEAGYVEQSP